MPSTNEKESLVYNNLVKEKKRQFETSVSLLLQKLQNEADENIILQIKSCLENKNKLMYTNTDPHYQYQSMFMHLGVIGYTEFMINVLELENSSSMDDCKIRCHIDVSADIKKTLRKT